MQQGMKRQTGSNWMQSAHFLVDFSASTAYPTTPWGKTSRNRIRSEGVISKAVSQKKAVMVSKDVVAALVFLLGLLYCSPVFWGCMVSEGAAVSGLTCRSGIWSWWLCDSFGWGIAVSAERVTRNWSMGLFRQAYVQRSYWMAPQRCSKAPLSSFALCVNN